MTFWSHEIASRQHGMVSTRQLLDAGLTHQAIKMRVRQGRLHGRHQGVYAVGHVALLPLADEAAALLAVGPGSILAYRSSAAMWGLAKRNTTTVDVIAPTGDAAARGSASTEPMT